jgi:hypothetical protein
MRGDLRQGHHHKRPLDHPRMRYLKVIRRYDKLPMQQNIDIDRTGRVREGAFPAEISFDLVNRPVQRPGIIWSVYRQNRIEK